jgi:hypothetical protein
MEALSSVSRPIRSNGSDAANTNVAQTGEYIIATATATARVAIIAMIGEENVLTTPSSTDPAHPKAPAINNEPFLEDVIGFKARDLLSRSIS